jgi:hypothetical protein
MIIITIPEIHHDWYIKTILLCMERVNHPLICMQFIEWTSGGRITGGNIYIYSQAFPEIKLEDVLGHFEKTFPRSLSINVD